MTLEAKNQGNNGEAHTNPLAFVSDPLAFNKKILQGRIRQFHDAGRMQEPYVFYDRGLPDVIAYMDFFGQPIDGYFKEPCRKLRYDAVVLLPPWSEIYRQDHERMERFEQAVELHQYLMKTYQTCGYEVHILEPGTLQQRAGDLLRIIDEQNDPHK